MVDHSIFFPPGNEHFAGKTGGFQVRNLHFQGSYFQGRTVSFREGSLLEKAISLVKIYNQTIPGDDFFPNNGRGPFIEITHILGIKE